MTQEEIDRLNALGTIGVKTPPRPTNPADEVPINVGTVGVQKPAKPTTPWDVTITPEQHKSEMEYHGLNRAIDNARSKYQSAQANYFDEMANFMEKPLDAEERARREKAAVAVGGIGALGNVANAFSNLVFTGQGAPSQKLPEAPDFGKAIDQFREDERTKQKNYMNAAAQRLAMYKGDLDDARAELLQKRQLDMKLAEMQREDLKFQAQLKMLLSQGDKAGADAEKAKHEAYKAKSEAEIQAMYGEPMAKANLEKTKAQTKYSNAAASNQSSSAAYNRARARIAEDGNNISIPIGGNDFLDVPKKIWNPATLGALLSRAGLPTEIKTEIVGDEKTKKLTPVEMATNLGEWLQTSDDDTAVSAVQTLLYQAAGKEQPTSGGIGDLPIGFGSTSNTEPRQPFNMYDFLK